MKLKDLTKEELETMSYDEIAYIILDENNKKIKITDLFKKVCKALNLNDKEYEEKIADFFQILSTDQRFIMLEKGFWDLKKRHQSNIVIAEDEEDEEDSEEELEESEDEIEEEDNIFYDEDEQDDDTDDDYKDLVIVDSEEDEENTIL